MNIDVDMTRTSSRAYRTRGLPRHCLSCATVVYPEDLYCARCGRILPLICVDCGTPVSHPVAFHCVRCGRKLAAEPQGRYR